MQFDKKSKTFRIGQFFVKSKLSTSKNAKQQYFQNFCCGDFVKIVEFLVKILWLCNDIKTNIVLWRKNCHSEYFEVLYTKIDTNITFWQDFWFNGIANRISRVLSTFVTFWDFIKYIHQYSSFVARARNGREFFTILLDTSTLT